ncbi:hypothetical protein [Amycolatopsis pittospori]|uniref:hypothetical protein n=1 Tax=Amycolatopsis pittospori TaxID=2749434 RepID=UPI0015F0159B|nr:hypothetical protein [Amycolatopsis pittospori]
MEIAERHQWQLNALTFLYAYTQYVLVHERVMAGQPPDKPAELDQPRIVKLAKVVDDMILDFRKEDGLNDTERRRVVRIARELKPHVLEKWPRGSASLTEWIASAAAHFYCEEHVNNGYVRMGRVFDQDMADRFLERVEFCRGQTLTITKYANKVADGEPLTEGEENQLEVWKEDAVNHLDNLDSDFGDIKMYVDF